MKITHKVRDRVFHEYLGAGSVVDPVDSFLISVLFDIAPHRRYNMGKNPELVFQDSLTKIWAGSKPTKQGE